MAKISISLPDPLKEQLDRYADAHQLSVSEAVQRALEALLQPVEPATPPAPPAPEPEPGQDTLRLVHALDREVQSLRNDLAQTQHALTWTQQVLDQHRQCLMGLGPLLQLSGIALTLPPSILE